jgi:glutaredoxin
MKLYRQGKISKVSGFDDKMKKIFLDQPSMGTTVGEYVNERMASNTKSIIKLMIGYMYEGIQKRTKEPGFVKTLLSINTTADGLDLKVPDDEDEDVLEKLNIKLLDKVRQHLSKFDLSKSSLLNNEISIAHSIMYINKLMKFVNGVKNYIKSKKKPFVTTTKSINNILQNTFVYCDGIDVVGPKIPQIVKDIVNNSKGFKTVNANIFWRYYLIFVALNGLKIDTQFDDTYVKQLVVRVSERYIKQIPRKLTQEQLDNILFKHKISIGDVIIYSLDDCPACDNAKKLLLDFTAGKAVGTGKSFVVKKEVDVPFDLRLKLSDIDGTLAFPIIVAGGKYLGGLKELQKVIYSPNIRPSVNSAFMPSADSDDKIIVFSNDYVYDDENTLTEYVSSGSSLGTIVAVGVATAITGFSGVGPTDLAKKVYTDEVVRQNNFENRQKDIFTELKKDIFKDIARDLTEAGSKIIDLEKDRKEEIKTCGMVLAKSKITDFHSIEKAGQKYINNAKELLHTQMSSEQLNRMVSNTAQSLIREMNLDYSTLEKLKQLKLINDDFEPNIYTYSMPLFESGGLTITPPPVYNEIWDGMAKPLICDTFNNMDVYIDKYIDCYTEATFETACPRLNHAIVNIANDAFRQIEPRIQQRIASSGRDLAQAQIDRVTDQAYGIVSNVLLWCVTVVTYYIIMSIFKKSSQRRITY